MGIMEGRDAAHIRRKYSDMFRPALITNWQVWPLAQVINFRFMPLAYRVPFQSSCGVFWTLYLSILNSRYYLPLSGSLSPLLTRRAERNRYKTARTLCAGH